MTTDGGSVKGIGDVISSLRSLSGEIDSCAVLSKDGKLLYSAHSEGVERERVQAMLSALYGISVRTARADGAESVAQVRVKTSDGHLLMVMLDDGGCLASTTGPEARVGLVLYDMRNAREEVLAAVEAREV